MISFSSKPKESCGKTEMKENVDWRGALIFHTHTHTHSAAYHGPVDVPEGSLLAVEDLPLGFILFPVDPADEISWREEYSFPSISITCSIWMRTRGERSLNSLGIRKFRKIFSFFFLLLKFRIDPALSRKLFSGALSLLVIWAVTAYISVFTCAVCDPSACTVVACVALVTEHTYLTWASACM